MSLERVVRELAVTDVGAAMLTTYYGSPAGRHALVFNACKAPKDSESEVFETKQRNRLKGVLS